MGHCMLPDSAPPPGNDLARLIAWFISVVLIIVILFHEPDPTRAVGLAVIAIFAAGEATRRLFGRGSDDRCTADTAMPFLAIARGLLGLPCADGGDVPSGAGS